MNGQNRRSVQTVVPLSDAHRSQLNQIRTKGNGMSPRNLLVGGGLVAAGILCIFGIACIVIGIQGRNEVQNTLAKENIVGPEDSSIAGQLVDTGSEAKTQAETIRRHQLEAAGGLTYSEVGRFSTPDGNPAGTNDANAAAKDAAGKPIANPVRTQWVTATALSTALNTAYFAEQVGTFAIVMGAALLLTGIGFGVLSWGALRHIQSLEAAAGTRTGTGASAAR